MYKNPNQDLKTVQNFIKAFFDDHPQVHNHPLLLLGDFNEDSLQPSTKLKGFQQFLSLHKLAPVHKEQTTDYHTCLDHIYTNVQNFDSGVMETYWSDHKVIWIII